MGLLLCFFLIFNNKWATKIVTGLGNPNPEAGPGWIADVVDNKFLNLYSNENKFATNVLFN